MKKIIFLFALAFLFISISQSAQAYTYNSQICDNDPIAGSQCSSPTTTNWTYVSGKPSSYNSDHRFSDGTMDLYSWSFSGITGAISSDMSVSVYIDSKSFTGTASYTIKGEGTLSEALKLINQNIAPGGWNSASHGAVGPRPTISVNAVTNTSLIGADAVKVTYVVDD